MVKTFKRTAADVARAYKIEKVLVGCVGDLLLKKFLQNRIHNYDLPVLFTLIIAHIFKYFKNFVKTLEDISVLCYNNGI